MKRITAFAVLICILLCACAAQKPQPTEAAPATQAVTQAPTQPPTESPTEPPTEPTTVEELAQKKIKKLLKAELRHDIASIDIDAIYQYPELPTGCEPVALTMAINALGYDLSKTEIADQYLIYDGNYAIGYCGDPATNGGAGVWPIGIVRTVENFTKETGAKVYAHNTSKQDLENLCKLVAAGCPVLVWTTYYMDEPMYNDRGRDYGMEYDGEFYQWYDNEHCVVLCGYDRNAGTVDIADPLRGIVTVDADRFERINAEIGRYSVALLDTSKLK